MRKNLMNKMRNSHDNDKQPQSGVWLYAMGIAVGYVTSNGEYLDLRQRGLQ